ncbi:PTS sugar transporter subunit IIB [Sporomusa acidovorans]|uniref:PTS system cellobiose-specific EIIB component n=1 Tax=Sporomusa acidovorans (strain ATCC 49682 / DSM 3132 / Mol) TaxID=1123286 RepID=A0ABZ3JAK7_SPOA4|nr:PTS sugar transporter subunit IIB [Sporomusa acidovorans]OZC21745.1 lichenan-specific phosphotransferase enzyme IIB component [Sporomusa acidovorans DSM 3132]SDD58331.1 PTS system, cellobiose-specific IIB component [Sporomusa acidovorans]
MKILLVCSGGMSSAIVVKAIEKEAVKVGLTVTVKSVGSGEFGEEIKNGWDIALVAPQVRHRLAFFQEAAADYHVPVTTVTPQGYNPLGGAIILADIKKVLG